VQGKNFQESLHVDYTTDAQTTQDTVQIYGGWVMLHGASTGMSGLFDLFANSQARVQRVVEGGHSDGGVDPVAMWRACRRVI
jgi:hypothetical protein